MQPAFAVTRSHLDASVNHLQPTPDGGMFEARYVQRTPDYFIVYLSSHTGCNQSCRFCHLTATGQVTMAPATLDGYLDQARAVMATYDSLPLPTQPDRVNFNFMARGEPLANPVVLRDSAALFAQLEALAKARGLRPKFNLSSILPRDFDFDLEAALSHPASFLYYSLYSMSPKFRKRWLPKALPPEEGLDRVAAFQRATGRRVVLHWAFIQGENDSLADIDAILDAVHVRGIKAKFNLVRYNPHDARHGVEPPQETLDAMFARMRDGLGDKDSRIVPRVGFDVKASCGMFVEQGCME